MPESRPLRVFLCHSSGDKPIVRELFQKLSAEGWIDAWLDEEKLLPGQDWNYEIEKALDNSDAVIVTLSTGSVSKEGYIQKELRFVLDIALEKPEGTIFILPVRLDDCERPRRLRPIQGIDYFPSERRERAYTRLLRSLEQRANMLSIFTKVIVPQQEEVKEQELTASQIAWQEALHKANAEKSFKVKRAKFSDIDLDLYRFIQLPSTPEVPYTFWIGKYPVTNAQYERFLNATDYAAESYWHGFLKFNEDCIQIGRWGNEGLDWLKEKKGRSKKPPLPVSWDDSNFGISNPDNPVVGISWYEANAYCNWLDRHWNELAESHANSNLQPRLIRLPLDTEWTIAAGGETPSSRYPWDAPGKTTTDKKEIIRRANVSESNIGHTTPVNAYLRGASPHGVMDMSGNAWEWQANYQNMKEGSLVQRGGSWIADAYSVCVSFRGILELRPYYRNLSFGYRVVCLPSR